MMCEVSVDANVVSLFGSEPMTYHPAIKQVEAYWEGLRGGRLLPLRSEIDPRGIERALEHAFVLERVAPGIARFRLAGMHLNDLMGMEVRGMPLTTFFTPDARRMVSDALEHVFEEPATVRFHLVAEPGVGKPALSAELLILPLRSDLGDVSRALGILVSKGETGRTPRRFSIAAADTRTIRANRPHFDDRRAPRPAPVSVPEPVEGFADKAAPFGRAPGGSGPTPSTVKPVSGMAPRGLAPVGGTGGSNDATPDPRPEASRLGGPGGGARPRLRLIKNDE